MKRIIVMKYILLLVLTLHLSCVFAQKKYSPELPKPNHNLILQAPINTWDEAVPLGNGLMGGLLWGENNTIRLSLDRGDLWDERTNGEPDWWKKYTYKKGAKLIGQGKYEEVNDQWDKPYGGVTPTKLSAGRMEIQLPVSEIVKNFELNLSSAEGIAHFISNSEIKVIYCATEPVVLLSIKGMIPNRVNLLSNMDIYRRNMQVEASISSGGTMEKLGYPEAVKGKLDNAQWYIQEAADGLKYCVYVQSRQIQNETLLAIAITTTNDTSDFLSLAKQRCALALGKGYEGALKKHKQWWEKFWLQSSISIPDEVVQRQYNLVQYFYGAASRADAPPMPLQGVWTADNGSLPPWKGDYHNDLNTQMTYMAYQESGRFDQGLSYINYLWDRRKVFRDFAKYFYETDGLACPGVMSYAGQPLGGWGAV
ncbi:MAG: glycoside hydrolase N-terminal domain-containing protein [Bacteroidota bacterium]|nr:glycoside hydrolase N-terminal domain-containing protein [Bacteroidota bacterium]